MTRHGGARRRGALLLLAGALAAAGMVRGARGHGAMLSPTPRQLEPMFWYQVGCMIGCTCSGGGKEMYPTPQSVGCSDPLEPTLKTSDRTWNVCAESPRGD